MNDNVIIFQKNCGTRYRSWLSRTVFTFILTVGVIQNRQIRFCAFFEIFTFTICSYDRIITGKLGFGKVRFF